MIIEEEITFKKKVFMKILSNKEVILTWNLLKIRKIKQKMASLQKIRIINY